MSTAHIDFSVKTDGSIQISQIDPIQGLRIMYIMLNCLMLVALLNLYAFPLVGIVCAFSYVVRNKICPNLKQAAEVLGVDESEVLRLDAEGAPIYAERLLYLWDKKHIAEPGWSGWIVSRGALRYKKYQWRPDNILNARYEMERAERLQNQLNQLHSISGVIHIIKKIFIQAFKAWITKPKDKDSTTYPCPCVIANCS